ncbi:MAG: hypothetical protein JWN04_3842 [Myxococcaceae bacterium]|nr:hypothetical protein [Myxococcaceae bacterium]
MPYIISAGAFAKLAGVSKSAISHAISRGPLSKAMINDRVDLESAAALRYLASKPLPTDRSGLVDTSEVPDAVFDHPTQPLNRAWIVRLFGRFPNEFT